MWKALVVPLAWLDGLTYTVVRIIRMWSCLRRPVRPRLIGSSVGCHLTKPWREAPSCTCRSSASHRIWPGYQSCAWCCLICLVRITMRSSSWIEVLWNTARSELRRENQSPRGGGLKQRRVAGFKSSKGLGSFRVSTFKIFQEVKIFKMMFSNLCFSCCLDYDQPTFFRDQWQAPTTNQQDIEAIYFPSDVQELLRLAQQAVKEGAGPELA